MTDATVTIHLAARARRGRTDAALAILERRLYAVLATRNDDGSPHLAPVMFLFANERIAIETGGISTARRRSAFPPTEAVGAGTR